MKILRGTAVALLTAGLLFLFFRGIEITRVWGHIRNVHPGYLILFAAGLLVQQWLRGYRWAILLRPRKASIRTLTLMNFTLIGFLINSLLPGRLGEPARGILVARKEQFNAAHGLASVVLERLIDAIVVVSLFLLTLIFLPANLTGPLESMRITAAIALPLFLAAILVFYLINRPGGFAWVSRQILRLVKLIPSRRRERISKALLHFVEGLRVNLGTLDFIKLILSSFSIWLVVVPTYWLLFRPLGIEASLLEALLYYCILAMAASIPTPGMAGSLDAGSRMALVSILGADPNRAVAYTLVMHVLLILVLVTAGFFALTAEGVKLKGIRHIREET